MNADTSAKGLAGVLRSLNCDRAYGISLICVLALLALLEMFGGPARQALSFDRAAIGTGQWWRLLSAHFVHLDAQHAAWNGLGVVLMWALFARDYSPWRWAAIYFGAALAVIGGLWFLNPELNWYVGTSGALHGVLTAGTIAHLTRRDPGGWILAAFIVVKLGYEQFAGALPFTNAGDTIVDAHLYGAVGGVALALLLRPRRQPQ
jgi:rhomboid family GlyGly-CTERM serine protease